MTSLTLIKTLDDKKKKEKKQVCFFCPAESRPQAGRPGNTVARPMGRPGDASFVIAPALQSVSWLVLAVTFSEKISRLYAHITTMLINNRNFLLQRCAAIIASKPHAPAAPGVVSHPTSFAVPPLKSGNTTSDAWDTETQITQRGRAIQLPR